MCFAKGFEVLGFGCEVSALGIEHFQEIELTVLETNGGRVIGRLRTGQNVLLQRLNLCDDRGKALSCLRHFAVQAHGGRLQLIAGLVLKFQRLQEVA